MKTTTDYYKLYNDLLDLVISDQEKYLKDYTIVSLYNEETEYVLCEKVEKDPEDEWWFIFHTVLPEQEVIRYPECGIDKFIHIEANDLKNTLEDLEEDLDILVPVPDSNISKGVFMEKKCLTNFRFSPKF